MFKDRSVEYNEASLKTAFDQVNTFEADFGGTEILQPLQAIFELPKAQSNVETHIYLLTDGAVHNTQAIVDLIKQRCFAGPGSARVHTFGVGSGADERLIKGCAFAGMGNFTFIYKNDEIESKVIESLSKTRLDYLIITEAKIIDENDEVLCQKADLPLPL